MMIRYTRWIGLGVVALVVGLFLAACAQTAGTAEAVPAKDTIDSHVHYIEKDMFGKTYGCFVYSDGYRGGIDCNFEFGAIK
jgi:nitrous oxide reductase accessory protein NosL